MILLILIFISINVCQQTTFMILGLSTNMTVIYESKNVCNFESCPKVICDILNNTKSAYIGLYPIEKMTSCPKLSQFFKVNMIAFVLEVYTEILFPSTCNNMGDCIMQSCNSYLSSKESYLMAFTGQCFS